MLLVTCLLGQAEGLLWCAPAGEELKVSDPERDELQGVKTTKD